MEEKNVIRMLKEHLVIFGLELAYRDAVKIFDGYKRKYGEEVAYVYALAKILADHEKPPMIVLDGLDGNKALTLLAGKIRPADYSPYRELLDAKMFYCAAEYAFEKEGSAMLIKGGNGYLLDLANIPEP